MNSWCVQESVCTLQLLGVEQVCFNPHLLAFCVALLATHSVSESQICSIISFFPCAALDEHQECSSLVFLVRLAGSLRYDTRDAARANTNLMNSLRVDCV